MVLFDVKSVLPREEVDGRPRGSPYTDEPLQPPRLSIERRRLGGAGHGVGFGDQGVGEIVAFPVAGKCRPGGALVFDAQVGGAQQGFEAVGDHRALVAIGVLKHPDDFADDHAVDVARLLDRAAALDQGGGTGGLVRVVLGKMADEDVGIEPDQRARPVAMA